MLSVNLNLCAHTELKLKQSGKLPGNPNPNTSITIRWCSKDKPTDARAPVTKQACLRSNSDKITFGLCRQWQWARRVNIWSGNAFWDSACWMDGRHTDAYQSKPHHCLYVPIINLKKKQHFLLLSSELHSEAWCLTLWVTRDLTWLM